MQIIYAVYQDPCPSNQEEKPLIEVAVPWMDVPDQSWLVGSMVVLATKENIT